MEGEACVRRVYRKKKKGLTQVTIAIRYNLTKSCSLGGALQRVRDEITPRTFQARTHEVNEAVFADSELESDPEEPSSGITDNIAWRRARDEDGEPEARTEACIATFG
jgi:hypothetical protein